MRVVYSDQEKKITKYSNPLYWEAVEVRPRQASVLACVVLVGIREGLVSPRCSSMNSL